MTKFFKKLITVRQALRGWNREVFGNVTSNVQQAEQVLHSGRGITTIGETRCQGLFCMRPEHSSTRR